MSQKLNEDDIKADLKRSATRVDGKLSLRDYRQEGRYSPSTAKKRFGSWNEAKEAAGLENNATRKQVAEEDILRQLRRADDNCEGEPTTEDFEKAGKIAFATIHRRFPSFKEAKARAGVEIDELSETDLIRLVRKYADAETDFKEFKEQTGITKRERSNRTGTWVETLQKAGFEVDAPGSVEKECDTCGAVFKRALSRERKRDRAFCSRGCFFEGNNGSDHPLWEGGGTGVYYRKMRSLMGESGWKATREKHISDTCYMCSSTERLNLHHIVPIMAGGTNEEWNFMTLCDSCHGKVEQTTKEFTQDLLRPVDSVMNNDSSIAYFEECAD